MKHFLQKNWPIIFLGSMCIVLFYKAFFLGQVFYEGDNFHLNISTKYFLVQEILRGHVPLWNPYIFLGVPFFADFNVGVLNFTNFLYFIFPIPRALTLLVVFDFFGLAVGMYVLLRNFSLSKIASVFGAIVMSLSGIPFVLLSNNTFMQVIVYIPFLFLFVRKLCQKKSFQWVLLLVALQFFQFIAGHPQETYYTMLFISLYLLMYLEIPLIKRIGIIALYIIFPLFLSSVQLLPFIEYAQHANRQVTNNAYVGWGGLTVSNVFTFIFPTLYGSHIDGTWWGPQEILVGFIGIPTLLLGLLSILTVKLKAKWFYVAGIVLCFLIALGNTFPFFFIFYYLIPGLGLFRLPSGILVFFTFFSAILAAFGLEYLTTHSEKFKRFGKWVTGVGVFSSFVSTAIYFYANKPGFWKNVFLSLQNHLHKHIFSSILFYDTAKLQQMFQGIMWNIVFVSVSLLLTGVILWKFSKKPYQAFLIVLITLCGFFIVNPKVMLLSPLSYYDTGKNVPVALQPGTTGQYRILSIPVDFHTNRKYLPPADFFYKEGQTNLSIYQYDNNIERGIYQAGGYVSLVPGGYAAFIDGKNTSVTNIDFSHMTQEQLNLASVRYILSYEPLKVYQNIPLQLISKQKSQYIYENSGVLSRAYILENKNGHVQWLKNTAVDISLQIQAAKPSHVVLTDWFYPGWKALINGKEVTIQPYLSTFQEIAVPKGKSKVEFIYDPLSVKIGLGMSIIAVGIWIMCFTRYRKIKL